MYAENTTNFVKNAGVASDRIKFIVGVRKCAPIFVFPGYMFKANFTMFGHVGYYENQSITNRVNIFVKISICDVTLHLELYPYFKFLTK